MELLAFIALIIIVCMMIHSINYISSEPSVETEMKRIMEKRKANIKWQIERNLQAKKRRNAIHDLVAAFNYRDIKLDEESDKFYVIIKINKDVLIEREVK